jgi:hypothetical protein
MSDVALGRGVVLEKRRGRASADLPARFATTTLASSSDFSAYC